MKFAIDGYKAPRHIAREGVVAPPIHPSRGVAAGCGLATTMVKLVCLECFDRLQTKHPGVKVDAYIDDIALTAEGSEADVLGKLIPALRDLVLSAEN